MTETIGGDIGNQILAAVLGLGGRMDKLEARMDKLEAQVTDLDSRMKKQERLMEMLGAEFVKWRDGLSREVLQLRGDNQLLLSDLHEGFRRLNARIDLTDGTLVLLAAELRRPRELGEDLEKRLRELHTH
jgi:chromosome segregation ATPase